MNINYVIMPTKIKQSQNLQKHGIYSFNQPFQATPLVFTCWSLCPKSWNKIMHTLSGNRILGYRIGLWNCRKGLLLSDNNPSEKLTDIASLWKLPKTSEGGGYADPTSFRRIIRPPPKFEHFEMDIIWHFSPKNPSPPKKPKIG